ncbi:hypothetical protein FQA39_LY13898 [Lamprigera yunnana]|nr:hypothetical protein FQA39_LY13898 [Lamprigera yunnana]
MFPHKYNFRIMTTFRQLFVYFLIFELGYLQTIPENPCPNVFKYISTNRKVHGRVEFLNDNSGTYVLAVNMSVAAYLGNGQTFDTMWKPRQIGSKTLTFEMIEEKKILKIEDMSGNEVYLGWESVSEVWSLESVLRYRLSYSSMRTLLKKMWMLYAQEHWTKSYDLKSAVERLYEELGALELMLIMKQFMGWKDITRSNSVKSFEINIRLEGSEIGLRHFLDTVNKYIKDCSNSSSSSDEEVFKAVEQNGEETTEEEEESKKSKSESVTKLV